MSHICEKGDVFNPFESNSYIFVPVNKTPIFQPTGDQNSPKFRFCCLEVATEQL